jgi:hypothetical protein
MKLFKEAILLGFLMGIQAGFGIETQRDSVFEEHPKPVTFRSIGPTSINVGDGHLVTNLPVIRMAIAADIALDIVEQGAQNINKAKFTILQNTMRQTVSQMEAVMDTLGIHQEYHRQRSETRKTESYEVPKPLEEDEGYALTYHRLNSGTSDRELENDLKRDKRFIFAAIAATIGFVASSVLSAYSTVDLTDIKDALTGSEERTNLIVEGIKELDTQIGFNLDQIVNLQKESLTRQKEEDLYDMVSNLVAQISINCEHLQRIINSLMQGEVDATLFTHDAMTRALISLKDKAEVMGYHPVIKSAKHIVELKASYAVGDKGEIVAFVHVPLTTERFDMAIYEVTTLPIKTEAGYFKVKTDKKFLAVSQHPSTTFFAMTPLEMMNCKRINGIFLCEHRYTILKQDSQLTGLNEDRCLFALFTSDTISTRTYCSMVAVKETEEVTQLSKSTFAVFANTKTQIRVACHDREKEYKHFTGTITVRLASGCAAETKAHYLSPLISVSSDTYDSDLTRKYAPDALREFQLLTLRTLENAKGEEVSIKHHMDSENPHLTRLANAKALHYSLDTDNPIAMALMGCIIVFGLGIAIYVGRKIYQKWQDKKMDNNDRSRSYRNDPAYNGRRDVARYTSERGAHIEMNTIPMGVTDGSINTTACRTNNTQMTNDLRPATSAAAMQLNSTITNNSGFMPMPSAPNGETNVPDVLAVADVLGGRNRTVPEATSNLYPTLTSRNQSI